MIMIIVYPILIKIISSIPSLNNKLLDEEETYNDIQEDDEKQNIELLKNNQPTNTLLPKQDNSNTNTDDPYNQKTKDEKNHIIYQEPSVTPTPIN